MKIKFLQRLLSIPSIVLISIALVLCSAQPMCISKNVTLSKKVNVLTLKGKSFFPLGFYHVSNRLTAKQRMVALQELAAAGFNTIHAGCTNLDDYSLFLDEANRLGVYVITEFDRTNYRLIVERFRAKPAVLAWNIADDAGDHETKAQILELHRSIKEIDPNHYTYTSISGWSKKWAEFSNTADLIGSQSYPIGYTLGNQPKGLPNILIEVNETFNLARVAASNQNRPFIANVQAFKWDNQRSPTASEVYNMTYQSLLAGVKGILFFAYDDGAKNQLRDNPPVWTKLKSLVPEIDRLSPILINGTLTKLDTKNKELLAGQWEYKNKFYLIIVNTSQTKKILTSIRMPIKKSFVKSFFSKHSSEMKVHGRYLTGSIEPEAVHVYQIAQ
jgi:hypothetical protein